MSLRGAIQFVVFIFSDTIDLHDMCSIGKYIRCGTVDNVVGGIPGQCITAGYVENNKYDCFDRSDEYPFGQKKVDSWSNISINYCDVDEPRWRNMGFVKGFNCTRHGETKCVPDWCEPRNVAAVAGITCDEIEGVTVYNNDLCGNFTFWNNLKCPDGDWKRWRCQGSNPGQCVSEPGKYRVKYLKIFWV